MEKLGRVGNTIYNTVIICFMRFSGARKSELFTDSSQATGSGTEQKVQGFLESFLDLERKGGLGAGGG